MLIFRPKTKRYRISVDFTASGSVELEKDIPITENISIRAWADIYEELIKLEKQTGIKFNPDSSSLKIEEMKK